MVALSMSKRNIRQFSKNFVKKSYQICLEEERNLKRIHRIHKMIPKKIIGDLSISKVLLPLPLSPTI